MVEMCRTAVLTVLLKVCTSLQGRDFFPLGGLFLAVKAHDVANLSDANIGRFVPDIAEIL